jgi:hypothetical protein
MATARFKHDDRRGPQPDATREERRLGTPASGTGETPISIDDAGIAELIAFFKLLAKWDQEARCHEKMQ